MTVPTASEGRTDWLPRQGRVTTRARIITWLLALVAVALGTSIVLTWGALSQRADAIVDLELTHEADKFQRFAASSEARAFDRVDELLRYYVQRNIPDSYETQFTLIDGQPDVRSFKDPPARLDDDPTFVAMAASQSRPAFGWVDTAAGRARYGVQPVAVADDERQASLVTIMFRAPLAAPLEDAVLNFVIASLVTLPLAAGLAWLIAGNVLRPIEVTADVAESISDQDLRQRVPLTGRNDDLERLARAFNRMLDRLENAFTTQEQLLDDVAHELRTPLTVIRGHLEVMGDDTVGREETKAVVIDEIGRMDRLIDDLLLLAKAERPDFVSLGEVSLTELTVDVLVKARLMADRRWALAAVADGTVIADGWRLTQALMQLVANAVQHTAEGDRIAVGSIVRGSRLLLWVEDTGEGIDPADKERILRRQERGSSGKSGGLGLGLAIVNAIAVAHGGTVQVDGAPGTGAKFTLDLPARLWRPGADGPAEASSGSAPAGTPADSVATTVGDDRRERPESEVVT